MIVEALLFLLMLIPILTYVYFIKKFSYWSERGVPFVPPSIPFGNIGDVILRRTSILHLLRELYIQYKGQGHKYIGVYLCARKALFVLEPNLIKRVLSTDFQYFHDRDVYHDEKNDPLSANLVALNGQKWKILRAKLTPTFTSGKLKSMFLTVSKCAEEMKIYLDSYVNSSVEIKDILARFATDVIGSCAFGIECNSLKNPNTEFRLYGKRALQQNPIDTFKLVIYKNFPFLAKLLKLRIVNEKVSNFFMDVVKQTIRYREENNIVRNDFLQLLIQLKNKGKLDEDEAMETSRENNEFTTLTIEEIAAQAFVFFLAGFETSSTVLSFVLFELAKNHGIQDKVREEILAMKTKYNNELSYDGILEMQYLEKVVLESMRKYPPVPVLLRKCTKNYQIPETNLTIEKGTPVFVSVWGLHQDSEYFPEPEKFNPERFSKSNLAERPDYAFLPFGNGPRICIGLRFGMMQVKIALAHLVSNFKFELNSKTKDPLTFGIGQVVLNPEGGIWLNVSKYEQ